MKKDISLKQRFVAATLSLVMLISSLLGTTFAWFTDSATSSSNIIKTGNLDVNMYWSDTFIDANSTDWKRADGVEIPVFSHNNWEPGYTEVKYVKIANEGNLDLKWQLSLEVADKIGKLAEVVDVYYVNPATGTVASLNGLTSAGTLDNVLSTHKSTSGTLPEEDGEDSVIIAIAMHMKESAGNEYQGESVSGDAGFKLHLVATQYSSESDSFGPDYDIESTFPTDNPTGTVSVSLINKDENNDGLLDADVTLEMPSGIKATILAGTKLAEDATQIDVVVDNMASSSNIQIENDEEMRSINVHAYGVDENNDIPVIFDIPETMPKGLNMGNYRLYHIEDGTPVSMTLTDTPTAHNDFYYDPATGNMVVAMATYSEVAIVADTENAWNGEIASAFAGGDGSAETPYLIANADQFALLGEKISNDNSNYGDKHYKLISDINFGGEEKVNGGVIFYPIGYTKVGGTIATADVDNAPEAIYHEEDPDYAASRPNVLADGEATNWYTYGGAFKGVFDGNGNTIKNIYQNTWQMRGNYDGHYYKEAMGIFGYVYGGTVKNLTVDNFTSDGEFTPTGVVAAYAANATFENIAIKNCNPRVYNTGNGGIVGVGGSASDTPDQKLTFTNITVDNSNKISALWGSWDVACGGIMGMFRGNGLVHFENCHIGAQIDVYNDVCGNYQYYWYRYAGMVIGSIRGKNITDENGYTVPNVTGITASNCTVHFGTWNDYYYCELVANTLASYTHDHQFSRLTKISSLSEIKSSDAWTKTGNFLLNGECYHIVNKNGAFIRHFHEDSGYETVNGETVLKEDKQVVYLPFNQLIQGDGWGVKTIGFRNDAEYNEELLGFKILDREEANSINKFEAIVNGVIYAEGATVTIGDIFKALNNLTINVNTLKVFVSPVGEGSTVSAVYTPNTTDWTNGTLTFSGTGAAKIVINDYTYCKEAVTSVTFKHVYDNDCDTTCNVCEATREITHVYSAVVTKPTCIEEGYTTYTCVCGDSYVAEKVAALGHSYNAVVTKPTCTAGGYTTYTCSTCGDNYVADEVAASGHKYDAAVTAPTCTAGGYTTYTCECGNVYVSDEIPALGHSYNVVVTYPTCTEEGYTTYTCSTCGYSYVGDNVAALGHSYNAVITKPTCTAGGYTTYTCACGDSYVGDNVAANGHTEVVDAAVAPTCEETGLTAGKHCSVCNEVLVAQTVVSALGHSYNAVVTAPTCTEEGYTTYTCATCGDDYVADKVTATGHSIANGECSNCDYVQVAFSKKFTGDFLYRVGNANAVSLGSLFAVVGTPENVEVTIVALEDTSASGAYTANADWEKSTIKFSGTGVVKVTITADSATPVELILEVVDATNLTSATGTTTGGVFVLLNDVNTSTYVNYWNCTLYGNGFTYSLKGAPTSYNSKQGHGIIITKNAILDNLVIVGDVYNSYGAYTNQDYYNVAVDIAGETIIQNCYISGCAAPVRVRGGNANIKNTTLYGGAVANLIIDACTTTLENVTTANYDDGREVVGMGIVIHSDANETAKLVLNGTLTQYNFISESKTPTDTYAKNLHNAMFSSDCSQYQFGTSPNRYVNTGIISLTSIFTDEDITDNVKTNYVGKALTLSSYKGYVYTQPNTSGSVNNNCPEYKPTTQGAVPPSYSFDYTNKNYVAKTDGSNDYCYEENGKVNISMDQGDTFNWDTSILTIGKGITNYTVSMNGTDYTGKKIAFSVAGDYVVTYTYTDANNYKFDANGNITTYSVTYTKTVNITVAVVKATTKHAEFTFGSSNTASTTVTVGNNTYVMPNVSGTSSTIGSTTVDGKTIYYPIVEIIMSDGKTSHSSGWYAYFPVFSGAVTITDYANNGTGDKMTPYNDSTTTMPGGLSIVGDPTQLFKYQSSSAAGSTPVVKSNTLVYSSAKIEAKRSEYSTVIQYSYTDNAGATYYYYIGYHAPAQSYSSICVTPDTLVTMHDGTQKRIDEVNYDDKILVWNFYTGKYDVAPVSLLVSHGQSEYEVVKLFFDDGTSINIVGCHGLFEVSSNEFVDISSGNVAEMVGKRFLKKAGDGFNEVTLVNYEIVTETNGSYTILSHTYHNAILNGMLTISPSFLAENLYESFEVGSGMTYDYDQMQADIAEYGLYTYDEFSDYITYDQFVAWNIANMKIVVGKGYTTYEDIVFMLKEVALPNA